MQKSASPRSWPATYWGSRRCSCRGACCRWAGCRRRCARQRALPDHRMLCRGDLVEAPHRRRVGGGARDLGVLGSLAQDRRDRLGEGVERLPGLGLGRLDHQRLLDEQREVDRRRVEAEVEQALGEVERLDAQLPLHRAAGEHELVHAELAEGQRQVLGDAVLRAAARAGSWRSARRSPRRRAGPRRRASRCRRRRARSSRSCPGSRAGARST